MSLHEEEKPENHERWLLTYADLITLLMIFFVVMYAMSNVDAQKYSALSNSLSSVLDGKTGMMPDQGHDVTPNKSGEQEQKNSQADPSGNQTSGNAGEAQKLEQVKGEIQSYIKGKDINGQITMHVEDRGIVISLKDTFVFDSGQTQVRPTATPKIIGIGKILNKIKNYVRIEGHTDNVPIYNNQFHSNWELSAIRATTVTEMLIDNTGIDPGRLSAVGYGEYRPIASNATEAGRNSNRRVDIIIMDNKYNGVEKNKK